MTTADGITAPVEGQSADSDEPALPLIVDASDATRISPAQIERDSDTRAIPVMGPPSTVEPSAPTEGSPRPDLFDTVVLPVVPPRPRPVQMVRREPQRAASVGTGHDKGEGSAPPALRVAVGLLFLILLAASGALLALQASPSSFDSLRQNYVI